jgi:hypothetical protein
MGDITFYNRDSKREKDNVHVPGTRELEHKYFGVFEIGPTSLHIPPSHHCQGSPLTIQSHSVGMVSQCRCEYISHIWVSPLDFECHNVGVLSRTPNKEKVIILGLWSC